MALKFKKIGVLCKSGGPTTLESVVALGGLLKNMGCEMVVDSQCVQQFERHPFGTLSRAEIGATCDLAIVLGGDGSLLNAARSLCDYDIPLLGINYGRLGFLVDVSPTDMEKTIPQILEGHYIEEVRCLLEAEIYDNGNMRFQARAINDVVIHKVNVARMIEFEVYINNSFVYTQRSDGLIISTPTGSSAYALSGGGPLLHPTLQALTLVPICPHTLTNRPIVIGTDCIIDVRPLSGRFEGIQMSCDAEVNQRVGETERVVLRVSDKKLKLLHPTHYDYYEILRAKLNWATHKLQP